MKNSYVYGKIGSVKCLTPSEVLSTAVFMGFMGISCNKRNIGMVIFLNDGIKEWPPGLVGGKWGNKADRFGEQRICVLGIDGLGNWQISEFWECCIGY